MSYVITCGDEGVQINEGTRLAVVGSGFRVEGFSEVTKIIKKLFGPEVFIASSEENDWVKKQLDLSNWEQVNASSQQHIEALADREGLSYAGFLPFSDPKQLAEGVKGHMVRPHAIHIANKISFTVGGGEQKYNLGNYLISADWVAQAPEELVKSFLTTQVEFYQTLAGKTPLIILVEEGGSLGEEVAAQNKAVLQKLGFIK
jgi:hypothetical protein